MPDSKSEFTNIDIENNMLVIINTITAIRNIKASLNISPSKEIHLYVRANTEITDIIKNNKMLLARLTKTIKIEAGENIKKPLQSATAIFKNVEIFIPLKGLIDLNVEINRLEKQIDDMHGRLKAIYKKLENKNFIDRAPKDVVENEQRKKHDYESQLKKLEHNMDSLKD